ncbi:unnamed protein product [Zymoseptoria tritici ST99CH_1A5]|uniref:Uncharacterized protein n=3 Tax=Zymoseptoria tritici TaxID=1047171 RepID=A0A1X7RSL2_ZYMT9|nr:unnamed protein product [Zymoseptoria tritici ST99CH_3D7]SMR51372.1 unnamed protein product [Zymoseptoria tritici ST99CH_1E4]SMY24061.1 unnamed protein product [Zymoseptoria tritici ST99CH_1A5]
MTQQIHSTGRGGAGNIGPSDGTYTDGDIIREGNASNPTGSSGRGGAGNIGSPATSSPKIVPTNPSSNTTTGTISSNIAGAAEFASVDIIPESATRPVGQPGYENFHTGRAGAGNVHKEKWGGHSTKGEQEKGLKEKDSKGGLVEKVKEMIHGGGKREKTPEVK